MKIILETYLNYLNEQPVSATSDTIKVGKQIGKNIMDHAKDDEEDKDEETFDDVDLDY